MPLLDHFRPPYDDELPWSSVVIRRCSLARLLDWLLGRPDPPLVSSGHLSSPAGCKPPGSVHPQPSSTGHRHHPWALLHGPLHDEQPDPTMPRSGSYWLSHFPV